MFSSIIALLKNEKLTVENFAMWKSNLNMIPVIHNLQFVLTEVCLQIPAHGATQVVRDAHDR